MSWYRKSAIFCLMWLLMAWGSGSGCLSSLKPYKPKFLRTKRIVFYLDRRFNQGQRLPVDLVFVTPKGSPRQVLSVGADRWFQQHKRDAWPFKQSLSFHQGMGGPIPVELKPPPDLTYVVILADYIDLKGARGQQVVLDAHSKKTEAIFVTSKGIFH